MPLLRMQFLNLRLATLLLAIAIPTKIIHYVIKLKTEGRNMTSYSLTSNLAVQYKEAQ